MRDPSSPAPGPLSPTVKAAGHAAESPSRRAMDRWRGPTLLDGPLPRRLAYVGARYGPWPLVRYAPTPIGLACGVLLPARRAALRANLRRVLGARPRWREEMDAFAAFAQLAHCMAESLGADRLEGATHEPEIQGGEALGELLDAGRGVVLVTAHTGLWDRAGRFLAERFGANLLIVMAPEPHAGARDFHDALRRRGGVEVLHASDELGSLTLLRHLRSGGGVAAQIDRVSTGMRALKVRFGDGERAVPAGPFLLAGLAEVPLVPVFARRRGYFDHEIAVGAPRRVGRRPAAAELASVAQSVLTEFEVFVRAHPRDWFPFDVQREE